MANTYKHWVNFRCFDIHLIRQKHRGIDLSCIDFTSLCGPKILNPYDGEAMEKETVEANSVGVVNPSILLEDSSDQEVTANIPNNTAHVDHVAL